LRIAWPIAADALDGFTGAAEVTRTKHILTTGRRHMTAEERAEAIQLYLHGATLKAIGAYFGRHYGVISDLMGRAGVRRGHKLRPRKQPDMLAQRVPHQVVHVQTDN
jgi:transposase-like protein